MIMTMPMATVLQRSDVDGDGLDDVLVGCMPMPTATPPAGAAYVTTMGTNSTTDGCRR